MTTPNRPPATKGLMMHPQHDQNSAAARAMRIRRTHDMEATELDRMRRRGERVEPGLLTRFVTRLAGRRRLSEFPEQLAAIETPAAPMTTVESAG
jgi:hypothetical protein